MNLLSDRNKYGNRTGRNGKRLLALCLTFAMMVGFLGGCGSGGAAPSTGETGTSAEDGTGKNTDAQTDGQKQENGEDAENEPTAMGRYVETMVDVDTGQIMDLRELSDGRLALLEDGAEGRWISGDNGETWKPDELPGWYDFVMGNYVYDMKVAPDGSVAVLYESYGSLRGETDEGETGESEEPAAEDATGDGEAVSDGGYHAGCAVRLGKLYGNQK